MNLDISNTALQSRHSAAFTLIEVITAIVLTGVLCEGMLLAYTQAARRAQWSGFSLAAQALTVQHIEQARSARWDPAANTNQIPFVAGTTVDTLDLPSIGTNVIYATSTVTVTYMTLGRTNPVAAAEMIQVDTVWPFTWHGNTSLFTNTVATMCAPDNPDSLNR